MDRSLISKMGSDYGNYYHTWSIEYTDWQYVTVLDASGSMFRN